MFEIPIATFHYYIWDKMKVNGLLDLSCLAYRKGNRYMNLVSSLRNNQV